MLRPPEIWPSVVTPSSEISPLKDLGANLWGVYYNVEAWNSALQLLQFCSTKPPLIDVNNRRKWRFIAAHEAVNQLHHLRERLALIKGHKLRACSSIHAHIDFDALRAASKLLDQYFPDIDALRHAIAHAGANDVLPHLHAPPSGWLLTKLEDDGRFSAHYQGIERSLEITSASLLRITEVADHFFGGFLSAAKVLEEQGYAE